jgi:hypothetical protein
MYALAPGGTRQGGPRRDRQSGQGKPPAKSQGQHQGLGGRSAGANNAIVRAKLPPQTPALPASSWRRGGRGVGVTATSGRMHQSYIQLPTSYVPEMRGSSPYPYAVRKSPGRQSEKRLQLAFLLASWQTWHGNWSTRRSAWQASKKKIPGKSISLNPLASQ